MQEPQATKHVSGQAVVECRARLWFQDEVCAGIRAFEMRSAALRAGLRQSGRGFSLLTRQRFSAVRASAICWAIIGRSAKAGLGCRRLRLASEHSYFTAYVSFARTPWGGMAEDAL